MAVTLADALAGIRARGYGTDSEPDQIAIVRSALRRIYGLRRWHWLDAIATITCTPGSGSVSLVSVTDLRAVDAVRISSSPTDRWNLDAIPVQELREMAHENQVPSAPRYWTQVGNAIFLYPIPDRAYSLTVDYNRLPLLPTATGDTVALPDEYLDVVVWAGVRDLSQRQRDWSGQAAAKAMHDEVLTEMIREDSVAQRQSPTRVQRSSFWDAY